MYIQEMYYVINVIITIKTQYKFRNFIKKPYITKHTQEKTNREAPTKNMHNFTAKTV